ncbi:uncharacterized protein LOC122497708 [Leptopilina heterotoma]|uniref:uncharacterized protein LOC122497708 n=1 Tax=Leptopilina heterotoma TaxID=63436 RepID=UPI001CA92B87|nr:uncharacterized protein LOC122497708 [Leptopilina heterotoma]XP_043460918.1 uncharacterized protein LOC122497708 [Leptopilina heterotoma]
MSISMNRMKDIHLILGMWGAEIKTELLKYIRQDCFYPNVCAFCFKQHEETDVKLWITCESCKIVSYCSENHMLKHKNVHQDFDRILLEVLSMSPTKVNYFYELMNIVNAPTQRPLILMSFIDEMSEKLMDSRGLYRAEEEMLKFLPHCEACTEVNPEKMVKCHECLANFCSNHHNDLEATTRHAEFCSDYLQSFIMEAYNLAFDDVDILALIIQSTGIQKEKSLFPNSIYEFLETQIDFYRLFETLEHPDHYQISSDFKLEENISDLRAFVSVYLTKPLSLIYAIKKLEIIPPEETIIHVIGSTADEIKNLNQWEFLLQWFPDLKKLTIVFVGKELSIHSNISDTSLNDDYLENSDENNIEETSITYASQGNQLHFQFSSSLYKTYYENSNNFQEPNFVIAYNPGLTVYSEWNESLLVLKNFQCPFIFTSYYKEDALLDHDKMKKVIGEELNYHLFTNNPYKSLRPLRFYGNSYPLVYKNNFITIYKSCNPEE